MNFYHSRYLCNNNSIFVLIESMKNTLFPCLLALGLVVVANSCNKAEDADCQSDTYWADITLNGTAYNTLAPCADWEIVIDSTYQKVDTQLVSGFRFSQIGTRFQIKNGDTVAGQLAFNLFFFAKDSLVQTVGDSLFLAPQNICAILDSNFHRLGSTVQDTVSVVTNIVFMDNNGRTRESYYLTTNWQTSGYGFQPIAIEGVVDGECRTRFEMNALLGDSAATDSVALYGRIRVPFK